MTPKIALAAAAATLMGAPALAQPNPAVSPTETTQTQFSDADVQAFARATARLQHMQSAEPAAQAQAVTQSGLTVEKYNRMGQQVQSDTGLRTRVQQAMQMATGADTGQSGDAVTAPDHRTDQPR